MPKEFGRDFNQYIQYCPFILFFIALLILHFLLPSIEDDLIFLGALKSNPDISSYLNNYYFHHLNTWSSRFFTNLILPILAKYTLVWDLFDSILFVLMAFLIPKLLVKDFDEYDMKNKTLYNVIAIIITILFGISNFQAIKSAGYIATTLNYTWPFIFGILNVYLVKTYIFDDNGLSGIKKFIYYFGIVFSLIFTVNVEISSVLLLGAYLFLIYKNYPKIPKSIWVLIIIIVSALLFHKFNHGNNVRYYFEIANWVGNYSDVTFINKVDMAVTSLYLMMLSTMDLIMLAFFGLIGFYSYRVSGKKRSIIVFIPMLILILAYVKLSLSGFNSLSLAQNFAPNGLISHGLDLKVILILTSYIAMILTGLYGLYLIYKNSTTKMIPLLIFIIILAFISQSVIGFAPSAQIWYFPLNKYPGRWWIFFNGMMSFALAILAFDLLKIKKDSS